MLFAAQISSDKIYSNSIPAEKEAAASQPPVFPYAQNAVPCILTPSRWLGGQPHLLFCLPLLYGGLTYYRNIRIPFKVL